MLDLATLSFSSTVSRAAYFAVFLILALRQREKSYLWHWLGAIMASLLGAMMLAKEPTNLTLPMLESMQIFTLYMASLVLSWSGLRRFYGLHFHIYAIVAVVILTVTPALACLLVPWFGIAKTTVASIYFLCATVVSVMVVVEILIARREDLWSQIVVAVAFGIYALGFALSAGMLILTDLQISTETARVTIIFDQINSVLVYVGYVAMSGERANLQLRHQADTDALTGLFNRRGIQHALTRLDLKNPGSTVCVLLGDLDHFKRINDTLGHEGGDAVLKIFAKRLKNLMRRDDIAVRWGGEEFLVVLTHTTIDEAGAFAERLRKHIESEPFVISAQAINVTISIGVAEIERPQETFDKAIGRADDALYQAKHDGRNRVCR
ncbi:GGDEF domain-containing protein [Kushneria phyllosphaerae]|uniref:diguanylate cyclase n=1 Tax=Kushneria phyllosphaerae TaxID=2100822 RepID=A0A2R8CPY0_9GAMM|nr:GGDEF domain-containing protein [Kushneria phyllosphaerae]SPJ34853.1 Response regulator PleD [Kushneria phyllosphaerae]